MQPLTLRFPKALLPVGNVPALFHVADRLCRGGVKEAVVNLHHLGSRLREEIERRGPEGVRFFFSQEKRILGTGGAIRKAEDLLRNERFLVHNGDALSDVDLDALLAFHRSRGAVATLVLRESPNAERYGVLEVDGEGWIRRILDCGAETRGALRTHFCGIHLIEPELFARIPKGYSCIVRDVYMEILREGGKIAGFVHGGFWREIGKPGELFRANMDFLEGGFPPDYYARAGCPRPPRLAVAPSSTPVDPGALREPILVGAEVRVGRGCRLGPKAVIGGESRIGEGASLSIALVLPGSRIAAGSRVRRAIAFPAGEGETALLSVGKGSGLG